MVKGTKYSTLRTILSLRLATPVTTFSEQVVVVRVMVPQSGLRPDPQNL